MRLSRFHLATVKEVPADAEIASHRLMLRAGMLRKLGAGIYTWTPLGLRVLSKVEKIVREEMDRAGALELTHADDPAARAVGRNRALAEIRRRSCSRSRIARKPTIATARPPRKSSPIWRAAS